ncbi:methyltransferase domain-containing protein [Microcella humidisoli]|uniref:Methyltransferase domain-containing protein n=1 Tax=Microcella humidisoli TaxID=2963406 RepID=A0ABY5FXC7_9MICO|nr:methyltransferase domain-containing protein [Microcella humidisoli]UTT62965.1 methyltransferase domain-containing protein [Microcella humidisoli]
MQCDYFDAGLCRSCTLMGRPYAQQLAEKEALARRLLAPVGADAQWLAAVASAESGFRAKAKMVVGGTVDEPTLGILDGQGRGVDLRRCGIIAPGILAAFPALIAAITRAGLEPYDVPARRGELKHLIVTEAPSGALMVRFVVRSEASVARVRGVLPWLQDALPNLLVATANIHPEHKAVLEGEVEHVLTDEAVLPFAVNDLELRVRPQSFVQTNTAIAAALYAQARDWVDELDPASVWDLYCGVGGFALHCASPTGDATDRAGVPRRATRAVLGVEASPDAVASAELARDARYAEAGDRQRIRFIAADATAFALAATQVPELVIVNPPRRGLGPELAGWLQERGPRHVIYSSCNAESLARDLAAMPGYRLRRARALDMFPQSMHFEVITLLERA